MTDQRPLISRKTAAPPPGIVHLGLGAFFRAHGAVVLQEAVRAQRGPWGVIGVSLRSPDIRDQLHPQDNVYTAVEMGPAGLTPRVVSILNEVIFAPENPQALIRRLADPAIRIVSLTVTEKGYCHIPSTGELDAAHPDIQHDITNPHPRSAVGYLLRGLQMRRDAGLRPFTVLSCDNLPSNGKVVRNVMLGLARLIDTELADWIATEGRFPSTMVDRIVPATTPEDVSDLGTLAGYADRVPVFHEPFLQWVVEDHFVDSVRPAFEHVAGVELVSDVAPFELMKLRMLNGTHSALAYLGYLAGHETISATVEDTVFRRYVQKLWRDEISPTVTPPQGTDIADYARALLDRYANPAIRHRTWQIAMDGSQKLPQRILGTIADAHAAGRSCPGLCLAVAAWMRYVGGTGEDGAPIDVKDPLADRLCAASNAGANPTEKVENFLAVAEVFGGSKMYEMREELTTAYQSLVDHGARAAVERLVTPA